MLQYKKYIYRYLHFYPLEHATDLHSPKETKDVTTRKDLRECSGNEAIGEENMNQG